MNRVLVAAVAMALLGAARLSASPVQWTVASGGNGHWYEGVYVGYEIGWAGARSSAEGKGGYLACITSPAENSFVYGLAAADLRLWYTHVGKRLIGPWLGGYQYDRLAEPAGHWAWVSGEPWSYTNWGQGTPDNGLGNEDFLHFWSPTTQPAPTWNDSPNVTAVGAPVYGYMVEYNSIPAALDLLSPSNTTIITGGTGALGATVRNSAATGANNVNYTISAAVQSGSATLGSVLPGSGSLAPGASAANTVNVSSTNVGLNTIRFTASDPQANNSPQAIDATLTVLDHAAATFAGGSKVLDLDFGTVQADNGTHSLQYRIQNLPASYRAKMDLDGITEVSDPAGMFSTNAATFSNLAPGERSSFFDIFLDCSKPGQFSGEYRFDLSDQKDLNGHAGLQSLTLNVTGNVVPEPSTLALLGIGAIGLLACACRRQRKRHLVPSYSPITREPETLR